MNRSEIEEKYKWDLTKFCKNDEDFYVLDDDGNEMKTELKRVASDIQAFVCNVV